MNLYLGVVPDSLRSSYEQEELGHEQVAFYQCDMIMIVIQYLRDAHTAFRDSMRKTKRFNWPLKVEESKEAEVPEFYEGAFINMLLNKVIIDLAANHLAGRFLNKYIQISRILDQPYDINLQVTSVVSRFCLIPHVYLTEYALDPLLETRAGARTLYNTLLVSSNPYY